MGGWQEGQKELIVFCFLCLTGQWAHSFLHAASTQPTEYLGLASDRDGEGCVLQTDTQCFAYFSETLSMEDVTIYPENKGQVQKG